MSTATKFESMLTTIDNPHSPFDDFDAWYSYDLRHGHHTSSLIDRLTYTSYEISESDYNVLLDDVIDEIVRENVSGMHKKVTRTVLDTEDNF